MKRALALLLLFPSLVHASGIFNPGSGSSSGGGASSLEVFVGSTRSSPTASISADSNQFVGSVSGSTFTFSLNSASVTLQGNTNVALLNSTQTFSGFNSFTSPTGSSTTFGIYASSITLGTRSQFGGSATFRNTGNQNAQIIFQTDAGAAMGNISLLNGGFFRLVDDLNGPMSFQTNDSDRIRINYTGSVDILSSATVQGAGGLGVTYGVTAGSGTYSTSLTVAGQNVCRADGTNCPAAASSPASIFATTGTTAGFTGPPVSSPIAGIIANSSQFTSQNLASTTFYFQINTSSITAQGPVVSSIAVNSVYPGAVQSGYYPGVVIGLVSLSTGVTGTLQAAQFPALTGDISTTAGSLTTTANARQPNITTFTSSITVTGAGGFLTTYGITGGSLNVVQDGAATSVSSGVVANFLANKNSFAQVHIQNTSKLPNASGDYVVTSDLGGDTSNYINMGINSSAYSQTPFSITPSTFGYLYTSDHGLAIGAGTSGGFSDGYMVFWTSNPVTANERMRIQNNGAIVAQSSVTVVSTVTANVYALNPTPAYISTGTPLTFNVNNILVSSSPVNVWEFTTSGTKNLVIPPWGKIAYIHLCGGGGGGGGGEGRAAGNIRSGAGGGGGGICGDWMLDLTRVAATSLAINISSGGTAGGGGTTAAGGIGVQGPASSIYIVGGSTLVFAYGGGGGGAIASSGTLGGGGGSGFNPGSNGSNAASSIGGGRLTLDVGLGLTGAGSLMNNVGLSADWGGASGAGGSQQSVGFAGGISIHGSGGGGSSGGCTAGNTCAAPGAGGMGGSPNPAAITGQGGAAGTSGTSCTAGTTGADGNMFRGGSGGGAGGGDSDSSASACTGGNGGICGGGGGAGGPGTNVGASGGTGGVGCAYIAIF